MLLNIILSLFTIFPSTSRAMNNIAKPGCPTHCGNVAVPYPFGIGMNTGCSLNDLYFVTCDTSSPQPKLFLGSFFEIYNISDSELRVYTTVSYRCYTQDGVVDGLFDTALNFVEYTFSEKNKLIVIGCDDYALIQGDTEDNFASGCFGLCHRATDVTDGQCSGRGCCQTSIPKGLRYYNVTLRTFQNHTDVWSFNRCGYAFLGEEGTFEFLGAHDLFDLRGAKERIESNVPLVLDWAISPNQNCSQSHECKENSSCINVEGGGYRCRCNNGYEGNPYLLPGCQDINECEDPVTNTCYGDCINTQGSYNCTCPPGSSGDAYTANGCKFAKDSKFSSTILILGVSISIGLLFIAKFIYEVHKLIKKTIAKKQKEKFFSRNGGLLLTKQATTDSGLLDKTILFTSKELETATDHFNENRILGRGGQGTVYKGMLANGRIVAVKKSKNVDESQLEQFINEVVILSQVNHRNVVKLLGCCLETEVPILVSEFISNGTLYDLIQNPVNEFPLSLIMRLQIAAEVAGALAYLHSASSIPIYHRDIKTTNILLDENFRAKVSDFGTSSFVSIDQTHLTTLVKGTFGYLDPEYFQSSQFTEKSDVYSFGVVLLELLTSERPISLTRFGEHRSLATYFMFSMEEGRVMSICDPKLVNEGSKVELLAIANLALRCLNFNGKNRPTMKELASELDGLRKSQGTSAIETRSGHANYNASLPDFAYYESTSRITSFEGQH